MATSDSFRAFASTRFGQVHFRSQAGEIPILIFHINQQSSAVQLELMEALAPKFRSLAMDYPSYGMSDHAADSPGIGGYAECALAILDSLGISQAFVLGEAVGSAVAAAFARSFPSRTKGAILLNCPLMPSKDFAADYIMAVRTSARPTDPSGFPTLGQVDQLLATSAEHMPLNPTQSWMDRINVALAECGRDRYQASDALLRFDLDGTLSNLRCPTLLLTSEHSPFFAYRHAVEQRIADVQSLVVADCRFGMAWEQAKTIASHVRQFSQRIAC